MTQNSKVLCPSLYEVQLILGGKAVDAYYKGVEEIPALKALGEVRNFSFLTLQEVNAFMTGVDASQGYDEALAVDDLKHA